MITKQIYVTTSFAGHHCWPEAPDEVSFLRTLHRHKFGVVVFASVDHADRQIEFFMFQNRVNTLLGAVLLPTLRKNPHMSCEMMAELILLSLRKEGFNVTCVHVNEDGENGGIVNWKADASETSESLKAESLKAINDAVKSGLIKPV
jgi:hypothetical protein